MSVLAALAAWSWIETVHVSSENQTWGAAFRKGTNRVAITKEVFRFIRTHWRPVPTSNRGAAGNPGPREVSPSAGKAANGDDVEMIDTTSPHADACTHDPVVGADATEAVRASEQQQQENTAGNGKACTGMDIDGESEDAKDVADGDRKEGSGKEDSVHMHDNDDDDVIAVPSGEGATGGRTGQVRGIVTFSRIVHRN